MNIPGDAVLRKFRAGETYQARGWKVFVLGHEKRPIRNCEACQPEVAGYAHDYETCACLTCHGFYAATLDRDRLWHMLHEFPEGMLAVRTGQASGLLVLDAESAEKSGPDVEAGVDVLDNFEHWTGGIELPASLGQVTGSGGRHLIYAQPAGLYVKSRRILPNVDLKADGGYIAVPPLGDGRRWANWSQWADRLEDAPPALLTWLKTAASPHPNTASRPGHLASSSGLSFKELRTVAVIPAGCRSDFTRDLAFMLRRGCNSTGVTLEQALDIARQYWERYEQPDGDFYGFRHVEYTVNRTWHTVQPESGLSPAQVAMAQKLKRRR